MDINAQTLKEKNRSYCVSDQRFDELFDDVKYIGSEDDMAEIQKMINEKSKEDGMNYILTRITGYKVNISRCILNADIYRRSYENFIFDLMTEKSIFKTISIVEGIILLLIFVRCTF